MKQTKPIRTTLYGSDGKIYHHGDIIPNGVGITSAVVGLTKPQWEEELEKEFEKLSLEWEQHRKSNICSICDSPNGHTTYKDFIRSQIEKAVHEERVKLTQPSLWENGYYEGKKIGNKEGLKRAIELVPKEMKFSEVTPEEVLFKDYNYCRKQTIENIKKELEK